MRNAPKTKKALKQSATVAIKHVPLAYRHLFHIVCRANKGQRKTNADVFSEMVYNAALTIYSKEFVNDVLDTINKANAAPKVEIN